MVIIFVYDNFHGKECLESIILCIYFIYKQRKTFNILTYWPVTSKDIFLLPIVQGFINSTLCNVGCHIVRCTCLLYWFLYRISTNNAGHTLTLHSMCLSSNKKPVQALSSWNIYSLSGRGGGCQLGNERSPPEIKIKHLLMTSKCMRNYHSSL